MIPAPEAVMKQAVEHGAYRAWVKKLNVHVPLQKIQWDAESNQPIIVLPYWRATSHTMNDVILERCTNIKDKHGVLIYEGDIVRYKKYEVRSGKQIRPYREFGVGYAQGWITDVYHVHNLTQTNGTLEIIGNVHVDMHAIRDQDLREHAECVRSLLYDSQYC